MYDYVRVPKDHQLLLHQFASILDRIADCEAKSISPSLIETQNILRNEL